MDIKTLQWFQEICRCGSITKAASNLFITPQGLSRGIKALEGELGVPLLERTPNGVLLTPYGECLLRHAKPLLEENRELCAEIKKMRQQERGLLRVCSAYGVFRIMGPDFVLNFERENPGMSLDYMEYPDAYVEKEILAGNYDIGFGIGPINSRELELTPLFSSQVSLLVYEGHPLADKETASFSDLAGEPLILESHMFKIHDLVKESCRRAGLKRVCELLDIPPVLHMGSCVDISRMVVLASRLAKDSGLNISQLPLVGCAPEWMSEKAVSIGNYVVATGIDTFLGVEPQVTGSDQMVWWLTEGIRDWVEAAYTIETDIEKLGDAMLARIDEKRAALGI